PDKFYFAPDAEGRKRLVETGITRLVIIHGHARAVDLVLDGDLVDRRQSVVDDQVVQNIRKGWHQRGSGGMPVGDIYAGGARILRQLDGVHEGAHKIRRRRRIVGIGGPGLGVEEDTDIL